MDISLNVVDKVIAESIELSEEYKSFCEDLSGLEMILDSELYTEAVSSSKERFRDKASGTINNTKDSIKAVGDIYGNTTDAGGSILNATWRVVLSSIKIVSRVLKWISKYISKVPLLISDAMEKMIDIPDNIKNKIKGNIKLYITADDIRNLFAKTSVNGDYSIIHRLDIIINYMNKLTSGDLWTTYFTNKPKLSDFFTQFDQDFINKDTRHQSDIAIIKKINDQYKYIKGIKFSQTVVEMNDPKIVDIYFSKIPTIKFMDTTSKERTETYIGSLKVLLAFIENNKKTIETLSKSLENKLDTTHDNGEFMKMSQNSQRMVSELFQTISKVIEIIGNIIRYIITDIKTIEKENNQIRAAKVTGNDNKENK